MNSVSEIETGRLVGRRIRPDDYPFWSWIFQNPLVAATLGGVRSDDETREIFQRDLDHWESRGFGLWLWHSKADRQFVGRGGLRTTPIEGRDEVEVGYALIPDFWGRGLATEIAAISVQTAFGRLGLSELVSFTLPDNRASRRVMEKCGFTHERDIVWKNLPAVLYRQKRDCSGAA